MGVSPLLLILSLLFALQSAEPVLGNAELSALVEIKSSLDPENKILTSWSSDGDPCSGSFEGVVCNEHLKVANISLQGKGLRGKVSPAISQLKCLSGLYLHYNSLTGEIPKEIFNLTELTDLYLNVNNLTGSVPAKIGNMTSLQALQLCCNRLSGEIPAQVGTLKNLNVLALQHNKLTGQIPDSLGNLTNLKRLDLSFNELSGSISVRLAMLPQLEVLDVHNNSLSGLVPPALKKLNRGFQYQNNPGLCGFGYPQLRGCKGIDNANVDELQPFGVDTNQSTSIPQTGNLHAHCNQTHCSGSSKLPKVALLAGSITATVTLAGVGFLTFYRYRRGKQKIGNTNDATDSRISTDQAKDLYSRSASPLVSLEYSSNWDPMDDGRYGFDVQAQQSLQGYRFTLEEIESATQHFSNATLLGRSNFSSFYKGILRDGTVVAIRSINVTSCKTEEAEFVNGLNLLTSLRHENLVRLRGFCCSKGRGECFLVYDFAKKGNLSQFLDLKDGSNQILDWSTRASIIKGIAKGIGYLHSPEGSKPLVIHQNISVEKILIDQQLNPLIMDSGLPKLLADDVIFSALKVSAAMGYLAPEYITTGRFTEKSDIFAFGVIILQILSGNRKLSGSMRLAVESNSFENFIDPNLKGDFVELEASRLGKIALDCTNESPDSRPTIFAVIKELNNINIKV